MITGMIKRILILLLLTLSSSAFDVSVGPVWIPLVCRPFLLCSVVLALSTEMSVWESFASAIIGGLIEDILCSEAIGLSTSVLLFAGALMGSFVYKNSLKKGLIYCSYLGLCFLVYIMFAIFPLTYAGIAGITVQWFIIFCRALATSVIAFFIRNILSFLKKGRISRS